MKSQPEQEKAIAVPIQALAEDAAVAEAMADGLRALDPQRLAGSLVLALVPEKDAQPSVRAVVEEWVESGRLAKGHEAVARKRLNPSEEASS